MHEEIVASAARLDQVRQVGIANMRSAMRGISLFAMTQNAESMKKARAVFEATAARNAEDDPTDGVRRHWLR
jgi:hypothetical protein